MVFSSSKPTKAEYRYTKEGVKVRVSVRTGRIIPYPKQSQELDDFVLPSQYVGMSILRNEILPDDFWSSPYDDLNK